MTDQPLVDAPRASAGDEVVTVTLNGLTLADVAFAAPAQRPGPLQLRESFLTQYAAAIKQVGAALEADFAARSFELSPATADVRDPYEFLLEIDARMEELDREDPLDGLAPQEFVELMTTTSGSAQERCVRVVVDANGAVTDLTFGPTAREAQDLGRQVVRGYRRACADVREAVAEVSPRAAERTCAMVQHSDGEDL